MVDALVATGTRTTTAGTTGGGSLEVQAPVVPAPADVLRPGMSAQAEIEVERLEKATAVPLAAILEAQKSDEGEQPVRVLQGIRQIVGGTFFFSAALLGSIVSGGSARGGGSRGEPARMLSDRQLEIFEMVGRGFDSHSMAEKLGLSAKTIDAHKANIRQKLGLASARELLMEAVRWVEK
jgi:DNA-binding CsgD family transcriptional regulator